MEAAVEKLLAARERMGAEMEEVLVAGMSIVFLHGKKRNPKFAEMLSFNAEANTMLIRHGRIIETVDIALLKEIVNTPEPLDIEGMDDDEDSDTSHGWRGADGALVSVKEFEEGMARRDSMPIDELDAFARKMSGYTGPAGGPDQPAF